MNETYSDSPIESPKPDAQDPTPAAAGPQVVVFEDLTLAEALTYLVWRPGETARLFWRVLTRRPGEEAPPSAAGIGPEGVPSFAREPDALGASLDEGLAPTPESLAVHPGRKAVFVLPARLVVLALALLLAMQGGVVLHDAATNLALHLKGETNDAGLWFMLAGALVFGFELFQGREWWAGRFPRLTAWLRRRLGSDGVPRLWSAGLIVLALVLIWLAAVNAAGVWGSALLLALAGLLWLAVLVGTTAPGDVEVSESAGPGGEFVIRSRIAPVGKAGVREARPSVLDNIPAYRLFLMPVALVLSALAYSLNVTRSPQDEITDVVFTTGGFFAWVLSIGLWITVLAVDVRGLPGRLRALRAWLRLAAWRERLRAFQGWWTLAALTAIIVLGAFFRLADLESTPPEMTSDHIEKLLDALRVSDGYRGVFFPNNGGREGFQMYVVAFFADTLRVGFNFKALKLASIVEGVITLPALWWMARQVFGTDTDKDRRLGNWVGLALAGLVAVSSWHVMLSRLALRIVLTPLTTALVIGFLARVMRHNRMRDYVALGAILGAGAYFYQANRMLPIPVVIGIGLALLGRVRAPRDLLKLAGEVIGLAALALTPLAAYWYIGQVLEQSTYANVRELGERLASFTPLAVMLWFCVLALILRASGKQGVLLYGGGLLALVVVALAVYIPLYHYSELFPEHFWDRTRGRIFGEEAFEGRDPSLGEQIDLFWDRRDVFVDNYGDALRMFHWEGDGAWINNAHARPALDGISGGLVILGILLWGVRGFRRQDPVIWLLPLVVLVMLLPSAMTLAYTIENPSFTRASGTLPVVFLLAALPLGMVGYYLARLPLRIWRVPVGLIAALAVLGGTLAAAIGPNWDNYFTDYRLSYSSSWKPYREIVKPLRTFAEGEGSYGNAFMVAYTHWLDHRILGTMAGDIRWPNGLVSRDDVLYAIHRNEGTPYQYDPSRPLFFMYHPSDTATERYLADMFPGGTTETYEYTWETESGWSQGQYYIYRVQAGAVE
ncbi:MAG: hypothetical protein JXJ20_02490 [Anaerolineae bacterium]|nr:hypothetical protein [Anaerolineae bacterium]